MTGRRTGYHLLGLMMKPTYLFSWIAVAAFCASVAYTYTDDLLTGLLIGGGMFFFAVLLGRWQIRRNGS